MKKDPHDRPVRVINDDTTEEEMRAGHRIEGADPPSGNEARGGFGNRDGHEGYGTDSANGITAVSINQTADNPNQVPDNMRRDDEGRERRANQDVPDDTPEDRRVNPGTPSYGTVAYPSTFGSTDNLTEDGNNIRPDSRIPGQEITNADLARRGTNADMTDPDARESGLQQT